MVHKEIILLGYGYVATNLEEYLEKTFPNIKVHKTSRVKKRDFLYFDLADSLSWKNIPYEIPVLWTFPPNSKENVESFIPHLKQNHNQVTVIGTTSSFQVARENSIVNESTPFDLKKERARAEWELLQSGCRLVMSSGIYGPGRNPLEWVRNGRIGKNKKFVNMIHIDDLVQTIYEVMIRGEDGRVYIASDGAPQRWEDIISFWESRGLVHDVAKIGPKGVSKKVDSSRTRAELNLDLKFRNFQEAVFLMNQD